MNRALLSLRAFRVLLFHCSAHSEFLDDAKGPEYREYSALTTYSFAPILPVFRGATGPPL